MPRIQVVADVRRRERRECTAVRPKAARRSHRKGRMALPGLNVPVWQRSGHRRTRTLPLQLPLASVMSS
jgi:hypothetical protein